MEQIIYGDILFLINFSMDFLTLFLTGKILHRKMKVRHLLLSAAAGGIYGIAAVMLEGSLIVALLIHAAVSFFMCYIVFGTHLIPCAALFYGIGCVMGGAMTALYSLLNRLRGQTYVPATDSASALSGIPLGWMAVTAGICGIVTLAGGRFAQKRRFATETEVRVKFRRKSITFKGITDTGNFLADPFGGAPVIVVPRGVLEPILTPQLARLINSDGEEHFGSLELSEMRRIRMIPLSGVRQEGILVGFIPDVVEIDGISREACLAVSDISEAIIPAALAGRVGGKLRFRFF